MASEDVIELGSSEDEAEPAPKKAKPMPNAMVCIPGKYHDVTIKSSKHQLLKQIKGLGKGVTVKPVSSVNKNTTPDKTSPNTSKIVTISKTVPNLSKTVPNPSKTNPNLNKISNIGIKTTTHPNTAVTANKSVANPFATKKNGRPAQNVVRPQIILTKPLAIQPAQLMKQPPPGMKKILNLPNPNALFSIKNHAAKTSKTLNNLPPSITVKKATQLKKQRPARKRGVKPSSNMVPTDVPTVELDDDEVPVQSSASPVWYLRPEEQKEKTGETEQTGETERTETPAMETENNKEPEATKMIEITIEDSPIKPLHKRTHEVGAELPITIDDSPIKVTLEKEDSGSGSDTEVVSKKERNSKKQLKYPKETETESNKVEIEIEIPLFEDIAITSNTGADNNDTSETANNTLEKAKNTSGNDKDTSEKNNDTSENVDIVIENVISLPAETIEVTEKTSQKDVEVVVTKESKVDQPSKKNITNSTPTEFHPVYQSFIDLCFELENSDDMKKIVEKKIKGYYRQVPKEYTESEEFTDMVSSKIFAMRASPDKMYLYIKDIVDELNLQRKLVKNQIVNKEIVTEEPEQVTCLEESEYDTKRQRQIRKLEKTIKKLHRAIQKLEEQEVDFDDEDDSVYLLTERYKERMVRVYAKFCQLTNTKMPSEPRIHIEARMGRPAGPAKRLEKWINKKVPIGTPLPFPDFHDVLRCVREANDEDKLDWNEADIMEEARDLFTRCGKKLQRRRQENEWRLAASRIALDVDPAEKHEELKVKLEQNRKVAATKETEIFNRYADRQNQLKLEAEEIGDKEAEESPVESEEEDANDDSSSLENTEQRKERLKRLLHEKSKRVSVSKESPAIEESKDANTETKEPETTQEAKPADESDVKDSKEDAEKTTGNNENNTHNPETLSISDDSNRLESDIDELHLLQKLHSGNEAHTSSLDSSDSESAIAISDSLESSDSKKPENNDDDVISIENSSYSENETEDTLGKPQETIEEILIPDRSEVETNHAGMETKSPEVKETDCLTTEIIQDSPEAVTETEPTGTTESEKVRTKSNNDEYNESVEDILLASSEDENSSQGEPATNLRDDLISIDETVVGSVDNELNNGVEIELNIIIPSKENDVENQTAIDIDENSKDIERSDDVNNTESMDISQSDVLGAANVASENNVSMICDDSELTNCDGQEKMDVDQERTVEVADK